MWILHMQLPLLAQCTSFGLYIERLVEERLNFSALAMELVFLALTHQYGIIENHVFPLFLFAWKKSNLREI